MGKYIMVHVLNIYNPPLSGHLIYGHIRLPRGLKVSRAQLITESVNCLYSVMMTAASKKWKRFVLTLQTKLEIAKSLEKRTFQQVVGRQFRLVKSTVTDNWKNRKKITDSIASSESPAFANEKHCIVGNPKFLLLNEACWKWFRQQHSKDARVSGVLLQEKARSFFVKLYLDADPQSFKGSTGWQVCTHLTIVVELKNILWRVFWVMGKSELWAVPSCPDKGGSSIIIRVCTYALLYLVRVFFLDGWVAGSPEDGNRPADQQVVEGSGFGRAQRCCALQLSGNTEWPLVPPCALLTKLVSVTAESWCLHCGPPRSHFQLHDFLQVRGTCY